MAAISKRVLVLPDIHYPYEDRRTMNAVETYMSDVKWDECVYLGDVMDFDMISDHNKGNLRAVEGKTIMRHYNHANAAFDRHELLLGPKCEKVVIEGNHDYRVNRLIDSQPALAGMLEVPTGLLLEARGWRWVPFWSEGTTYRIGNAEFIHGIYTNDHHAKKHVQNYGTCVFYGHTHDVQCYSQVLNGDNKTLVGQSLGCLCKYRQAYMRGKPNKWQQAFGVFHFFPDGFFNYYVVTVFKHRFTSPEGKVYQG
jgi:predicted phosphodiesterase